MTNRFSYVAIKNGQEVDCFLSSEEEIPFAMSEWLFANGYDLEFGQSLQKGNGYGIMVQEDQFEMYRVQDIFEQEGPLLKLRDFH